jgi:peptidylprolyl isomerase
VKMAEIPGYKTTYTVVTPGSGQTVAKGNTVTVHATGIVKETGKKFW